MKNSSIVMSIFRGRSRPTTVVCFILLSSLVIVRQALHFKYCTSHFQASLANLRQSEDPPNAVVVGVVANKTENQDSHLNNTRRKEDAISSIINSSLLLKITATTTTTNSTKNTTTTTRTNTTTHTIQSSNPKCPEEPTREPLWEWHFFSQNDNSNNTESSHVTNQTQHLQRNQQRRQQQRLLIAQYSAFGQYAKLLEQTAPINKEYAKRWNHDYVLLQGITMFFPNDKTKKKKKKDKKKTRNLLEEEEDQDAHRGGGCPPLLREERSRFNKITLLQMALSYRDRYDSLLLLDADAMIYDFEYDITTLLFKTGTDSIHSTYNNNNNYYATNTTTTVTTGIISDIMLVAQRVHDYDVPQTRNINNGVTLWNLHHPLTMSTGRAWYNACRKGLLDNKPLRGDQYYLHQVLKEQNRHLAVSAVWDEFYYKDGTVIKHFQRSNMFSWEDTGLESRLNRIRETAQQICEKYSIPVESLDYTNYTLSQQHTIDECQSNPRRLPKMEWYLHEKNGTTDAKPKNRVLISQYSGFDSYSRLLNLTARINKAYARKWGHDFVSVTGTALTLPKDGYNCEPPHNRSMYNKLFLLHLGLARREKYDQLLTLDADAMIYDMDFDISNIMSQDELLAAHRVKSSDDVNTWNINNGVVLWNLHHNMTNSVFDDWYKGTITGLSSETEHGDQFYLQVALKRGEGKSFVHSLPVEFKYEKGTKIKHFLRQNFTIWADEEIASREKLINATVDSVCKNHPSDCENFEYHTHENDEDSSSSRSLSAMDCIHNPRRKPTLEWFYNDQNETSAPPYPKRRMLIAQYSGYGGDYTKLLNLTMPINQAYAEKWKQDFFLLQGTTLTFPKDESCEPPSERSRHNKIYLLLMALRKRKDYDVLLTLDADAMVYNFSSDISALVENNDMLAAHGAGVTESNRTWNINNGICLWNLRHPKTSRVAVDWFKSTKKAMSMAREKEHGDQHFLQMTLRKSNRQSFVRALATEFKYKKATVVKHFVRENNDVWSGDIQPRQEMIESAILEVCRQFPDDCKSLKNQTHTAVGALLQRNQY